ncbi:type I-E CRISPR-associated protein Cse1/CasA, partial [bacterium]|nr:type I-E CRISPR-associated protein Cse1/CasA [bacterium]
MKMNLIIDPWIPVLRDDGKRELCGLHDLFARAHEFRDLVVKPHERIALMRLLVCITQAALDGPVDEDEWEECLQLIQSRVSDYLKKWESSF